MTGIPAHGSLAVPERHYITMRLRDHLRRAMSEIGEAIGFAGETVSTEELQEVARLIHRLESKLAFGMGTIDQKDLDFAMKASE